MFNHPIALRMEAGGLGDSGEGQAGGGEVEGNGRENRHGGGRGWNWAVRVGRERVIQHFWSQGRGHYHW